MDGDVLYGLLNEVPAYPDLALRQRPSEIQGRKLGFMAACLPKEVRECTSLVGFFRGGTNAFDGIDKAGQFHAPLYRMAA